MKVYHDENITSSNLAGKTIAVIGYGIQGRAQACNWKDSGLKVIIGLRDGSASKKLAEQEGHKVVTVSEAAKLADVVCLLTPDMPMKEIYEKEISQHMKSGKALYFSHGFNMTFKRITVPKEIDVIMVAPKGPGKRVREVYLSGFGVPALIAIYQDASGKAREISLELAKGLGAGRAGVLECTFDQETITDLFGEQTVLCGGAAELVKNGFETLVEKGYPPEMAYFEVLHELKLITDLIQEGGITYMWNKVSETARYGGLTRGKRVIDPETKKRMKLILEEIENGKFAKEWVADYDAGLPTFKKLLKEESEHPIEKIGAEIRRMFKIGK